MSASSIRSRFSEATFSFVTSLVIVALFYPWLVVAYSVIAPYVTALDPNDQTVIHGFIEWFGTAYSFFLALAIVNVWSQFETVDREFDKELDAVASLLQTVEYTAVSDPAKAEELETVRGTVIKEIENYVDHVVNNYKFERHISRQHQNGDRILERIGKEISTLISKKVVPEPFIDQLFHSLNEAMDVRGDRISHSKPYAPLIIQVMAVISSAIWLLSFLGLVIYDDLVAAFLIGGVAFVIAMILVIFFDLGEPFGGFWKIHLDDWSEFLHNMQHANDPEVIFIYKVESTLGGQVRSWVRSDTCKLNDFSNSWFLGIPWKEFLKRVEAARPNIKTSVRCTTVHSNDLGEKGLAIACPERPLVVLMRGETETVLLTSGEINRCNDLIKFEEVFNEKIKVELPWF